MVSLGMMRNGRLEVATPSAVIAETCAVPAVAIRGAGTVVESWFEAQAVKAAAPEVPPTHAVGRAVPFHRIDIPLVKLVPVAVKVKANGKDENDLLDLVREIPIAELPVPIRNKR